jgi:hypothetical protein
MDLLEGFQALERTDSARFWSLSSVLAKVRILFQSILIPSVSALKGINFKLFLQEHQMELKKLLLTLLNPGKF